MVEAYDNLCPRCLNRAPDGKNANLSSDNPCQSRILEQDFDGVWDYRPCGYARPEGEPLSQEHLPIGHVLYRRYRIARLLGQGGGGKTYLAWDLDLGARVAIKEYFPLGVAQRQRGSATIEEASASKYVRDAFALGVRRFQKESQLLAQFRDRPNIVSVYDRFDANGSTYIVMRYVAGEALRRRIDLAGRLELAESLIWFDQLCAALGTLHAHEPAVVHGDIKPENIIISADNEATLIDFGSARINLREYSDGVRTSSRGYSPPEATDPDRAPTPQSDIFSLAATLIAMLTGEPRDEGAEGGPPRRRPEERLEDAKQVHAPARRALQKVLAQALDGDPAKRPKTIDAFRRAVRKAAAAQAPASPRALVGVAAALAAAVIGATILWSTLGQNGGDAPPETQETAETPPPAAVDLDALLTTLRADDDVAGLEQFVEGDASLALKSDARATLERLYREAQQELRRLRLYRGRVDGRWEAPARLALQSFERTAGDGAASATGDLTGALLAELRATETPPYRSGEVFRECDDCPEMVVIPSGAFWMGSPDSEQGRMREEGPRREVRTSSFAVGKFEVTVGEFEAFVDATSHQTAPNCRVTQVNRSEVATHRAASWRDPGFAQTKDHPVVCIARRDAEAYAAWLSDQTGATYRLLSEAEWEYAARAGTPSAYPWGDYFDPVHANSGSTSAASRGDDWEFTAPVGSFDANAFGLHDMHGNVMEPVADCWRENYLGAPTTSSVWSGGDCGLFVHRGGTWRNPPDNLRSASRRAGPDRRTNEIGLRIARTLP